MNQNVENLTKATKNLKIDEPKFEKWNELPPEIKLECIKTLDFKTKWNLRNTSHTERALVDSQKMQIYSAKFNLRRGNYLEITEHRLDSETTIENVSVECFASMFSYILNRSSFENLKIVKVNNTFNLKEQLIGTGPWNVKNLEMKFDENESISFCLDKISSKLDKIVINVAEQESSISHLMHRKVLDVPYLKIVAYDYMTLPGIIAQIWIKKDVEIGRTFHAMIFLPGLFEVLPDILHDRTITLTSEYIRFRTDNPSKHILLQLGRKYNRKMNDYGEVFQMKVIPAEMKKSEIDTFWFYGIEMEDSDRTTSSEYSFDTDEYGRSDLTPPWSD